MATRPGGDYRRTLLAPAGSETGSSRVGSSGWCHSIQLATEGDRSSPGEIEQCLVPFAQQRPELERRAPESLRRSFAFLGENCLDDGTEARGQILELADVIGREGLVTRPASPNPNLRRWG